MEYCLEVYAIQIVCFRFMQTSRVCKAAAFQMLHRTFWTENTAAYLSLFLKMLHLVDTPCQWGERKVETGTKRGKVHRFSHAAVS